MWNWSLGKWLKLFKLYCAVNLSGVIYSRTVYEATSMLRLDGGNAILITSSLEVTK